MEKLEKKRLVLMWNENTKVIIDCYKWEQKDEHLNRDIIAYNQNLDVIGVFHGPAAVFEAQYCKE